jgi:hypothetical protein
MVVVPPSATPKTSHAIMAFFNNIPLPLHSGVKETCRDQPTESRAFMGGQENRTAEAERNLPLRE